MEFLATKDFLFFWIRIKYLCGAELFVYHTKDAPEGMRNVFTVEHAFISMSKKKMFDWMNFT